MLIAVYLALNTVLCIAYVTLEKMSNPAARFGWMAAANIVLAVFLGLRNTPLRPLTAHAYGQVNVLHRIVGYTAVTQVALHGVFYMMRFGSQNRWHVFLNRPNLEGLVAGGGMLVLLCGLLRRRGYEAFLVSHVAGSFVTILFAGLHRPVWRQKLPIIMLVAAGLWVLDRFVRVANLVANCYKTEANMHPLPNGGLRLIVKGPRRRVVPGEHVFIWIPRIRALQTHPFTVVSSTTSGLEIVVRPHRGFTRDMYAFAVSNPGSPVRASIEGPYGSLRDLGHFDKMVLIAGGSGAAFTFGLTNALLSSIEPGESPCVELFWSVRSRENLSWFAECLRDLSSYPSINVALHVTGPSSHLAPYRDYSPGSSTPVLMAAGDFLPQIGQGGAVESLDRLVNDPGAQGESFDAEDKFAVNYARLSVREAVHDALRGMVADQRVLIAACGPRSMMDEVRAVAGDCITFDGPSVKVHCENFEW